VQNVQVNLGNRVWPLLCRADLKLTLAEQGAEHVAWRQTQSLARQHSDEGVAAQIAAQTNFEL
jgi:hypothetical protein